jgi:hypothetical protein
MDEILNKYIVQSRECIPIRTLGGKHLVRLDLNSFYSPDCNLMVKKITPTRFSIVAAEKELHRCLSSINISWMGFTKCNKYLLIGGEGLLIWEVCSGIQLGSIFDFGFFVNFEAENPKKLKCHTRTSDYSYWYHEFNLYAWLEDYVFTPRWERLRLLFIARLKESGLLASLPSELFRKIVLSVYQETAARLLG